MMEMLLDDYLKHHDVAAKTIVGKNENPKRRNARSVKVEAAKVADEDVGVDVNAAKSQERAAKSEKAVCSDERGNVQGEQVKHSRYIPQGIRRQVRLRDSEQCSYVDSATGQRCECKRGLQYDHIKPFALGGFSNSPQNLRLLCAVHNRLAAENIFGVEFMSKKIYG